MSETDECEIGAAKKRLNFYNQENESARKADLRNPVTSYDLRKAKRKGQKARKQINDPIGDSGSSCDLTQSLMQLMA